MGWGLGVVLLGGLGRCWDRGEGVREERSVWGVWVGGGVGLEGGGGVGARAIGRGRSEVATERLRRRGCFYIGGMRMGGRA